MPQPERHILEQGLAAWIDQLNQARRAPLFASLSALQAALDGQERAFVAAWAELAWVQEQISTPEHILGSAATKHGEIAEIAEVGLRRAFDVLRQQPPSAVWNATDRLGPADYHISGVAVQSKFINGINSGLKHMLDHAARYPEFGTHDGAYYHIPSDQHAAIQRVLANEPTEFSARTIATIKAQVAELEVSKNRSFSDLVRPAAHTYADVQQGRIQQTLTQHEQRLSAEHQSLKQQIAAEHKKSIEATQAQSAPTLAQLGQVALVGSAVGGGVQITGMVYQKWAREHKSPLQLSAADWQEISVGGLAGAAAGGISAAALYGLTNYSALSAPFAAAVVSAGRGVSSLLHQYQQGSIDLDTLVDLSFVTTAEAGIVALGAALGQSLIPLPILGALVGSVAARLISGLAQQQLTEHAEQLNQRVEAQLQQQLASLNAAQRLRLAHIEADILRIGDLTTAAFDLARNAELLLLASIQLAEAYAVPTDQIIRSSADVDAYMCGPNSG